MKKVFKGGKIIFNGQEFFDPTATVTIEYPGDTLEPEIYTYCKECKKFFQYNSHGHFTCTLIEYSSDETIKTTD